MTNTEKYDFVEKDFNEYIERNKKGKFYFDRILTKLLRKYDLSLRDYYDEGRKRGD